jgi:hypothetical protein
VRDVCRPSFPFAVLPARPYYTSLKVAVSTLEGGSPENQNGSPRPAAPADALALRAASDEHERTPRLDSSSIPMRATPLELRISSALTLTLSSPA